MLISQKRITNLSCCKGINFDEAKIGIRITEKEYERFGLNSFEEGFVFEPSAQMGINSRKNTEGWSYPDRSKPKEARYICTLEWTRNQWIGGGKTEEVTNFCDVHRKVYPRIIIPATNVELKLVKNSDNVEFIIARLSDEQIKDEGVLKQTINMILETFGFCEIFDKNLELITSNTKIKRCNWVLLSKDIKLEMIEKKRKDKETKTTTRKDFEQFRLDTLQNHNPVETYYGQHGLDGYYAFLFENTCFFECGHYGNATYIIKREKWNELSKLTKKQIVGNEDFVEKLTHNKEWENNIEALLNKLEKTSS